LLLASIDAKALDMQEYDARLCSAELIVLQADLRQLLLKTTPPQQQRGYQQRMAGMMGTLTWLCRRYAVLHGLSSSRIRLDMENLHTAFQVKKWYEFNQLLKNLTELMPLKPKGPLKNFKSENIPATLINTGKGIYLGYCTACHNQPDLNQPRPAYSLFKMAKGLSREEFIARMIVGVHGTPEIALQNPLSNEDIAGMFAYFLLKPN